MVKVQVAQLLAAMGPGALRGQVPTGQQAQAVAYDSRQVAAGSVFFACVGQAHDGHAHVGQALARGAIGVVCERPVAAAGIWQLQVADARAALAHAARCLYGRNLAGLCLVAITGTNGKTTTAALVRAILTAAGRPTGIVGTLGAHFGDAAWDFGLTTPAAPQLWQTLAQMHQAGAAAVVLEASSQALQQRRLDGLGADVGLFLPLTHDHLDAHGSMANYFAAKCRLFTHGLRPDGQRLLAGGDLWAAKLWRRGDGWFGPGTWPPPPGGPTDAAALACLGTRAEQVVEGDDGLRMVVCTPSWRQQVSSQLIGQLNVQNILAAAAVAHALGVPAAAVATGLAAAPPPRGRLQQVGRRGGLPQVVVDYAHTPDAVAAVLASLRRRCAGLLWCVMGSGGDRDPSKRRPMGAAAAAGADRVVVTSDNPRFEPPQRIAAAVAAGVPQHRRWVILERAEAIAWAVAAAADADTVAILGRGHEQMQQVGGNLVPCDDVALAQAALAARTGG